MSRASARFAIPGMRRRAGPTFSITSSLRRKNWRGCPRNCVRFRPVITSQPTRELGTPSRERPRLGTCPLCSHEHLDYQFTQGGTPVVRCAGCGLLLRNPQPSDAELDQYVSLVKMSPDGSPDRRAMVDRDYLLIDVPADIGVLQQQNPELAVAWRHATRAAFTDALNAGYTVEEFYRIEREGAEFMQKVDAGYRSLAAAEPERIVAVDGGRPAETIAEEIREHVRALL